MKAANKGKNHATPNPLEAFRESSYAIGETVQKQATASVDDLWRQLLGGEVKQPSQPTSGDLQAGEAISFTKQPKAATPEQSKEKPKNLNIAAGIDYRSEILHGEKRISKETEQILSQQIQEIVSELRQIVSASQELAVQFKDVAGDQRITKPGKYHINLFQFVLSIVRQARMKVESSGACLSMAKGKKGKKDYWSMFAQHGTSFAMNNERAIATQAG